MKKFRDFILEDTMSANALASQYDAGLSSENIPHDVDDANVKAKINAVLGHTAVSEYMNPNAAISQMEAKLGQLGISRVHNADQGDMPALEEFDESGEMMVSFTRYGEIMGKSVDTPMDEIEKEEKNYDLKIRYQKLENNSYKVYGELV